LTVRAHSVNRHLPTNSADSNPTLAPIGAKPTTTAPGILSSCCTSNRVLRHISAVNRISETNFLPHPVLTLPIGAVKCPAMAERKQIAINLAPADVRKEGPSFDLPIALGMLKLEESNRVPDLDGFCISGELALSGELRPVKGVLSIALEARRRNRRTLIVPMQNAPEAAVVEGVDVYGATSLAEVVEFLRGHKSLEPVRSSTDWYSAGGADQELTMIIPYTKQHETISRSARADSSPSNKCLQTG
jgi:Subunit ChlI of Mg-chelatase